jgi:hypothetical protein
VPATRPNRLENPLRKLRLILGDGQNKPMHQEAFAARVGIPVATLRSIEAGRRSMTQDNCLNQILVTLKATWNERDQNWHVLGSKWLYEKQHASVLNQEMDPEDPYWDDLVLHRLIERLFDLFAAANREQRQAMLIYLSKFLADTRVGFGIKRDLSNTEPHWHQFLDHVVWGRPLNKDMTFWPRYFEAPRQERPDPGPHTDAGGIFDFRARRSFKPQDYPAKSREESLRMAKHRQEARQQAARQQASTPDNSKNDRTYSGPKRDKSENKAEN